MHASPRAAAIYGHQEAAVAAAGRRAGVPCSCNGRSGRDAVCGDFGVAWRTAALRRQGKKLTDHSRPPDARAASQPIHESRLARRHTLRWPHESYAGGQQAVSRRGRYRRRCRGLAGRPANGHVARARRLDLCGQRPRREPRCMEDGRRKHRTGHRARWRFGARVRVRSSACLGRVGGAGAGALWRSDEGARHSVPMI